MAIRQDKEEARHGGCGGGQRHVQGLEEAGAAADRAVQSNGEYGWKYIGQGSGSLASRSKKLIAKPEKGIGEDRRAQGQGSTAQSGTLQRRAEAAHSLWTAIKCSYTYCGPADRPIQQKLRHHAPMAFRIIQDNPEEQAKKQSTVKEMGCIETTRYKCCGEGQRHAQNSE